MRYFETRYGAGVGMEEVRIEPHYEALWAAAFDVDDIGLIFDLDTPARAIPKLDAAIARFNHDPDALRPLLPEGDRRGLVAHRRVIEQMRSTLADHADASLSGVLER
ncbi:hypothetical protein [Nocardia sp. CC227C]|uniref:hypothetical protein n=1 Tax=Nocardia sp. CC227C TaxID=3044562 RepID=UPI00278C461D|nr:hypothetical protein [Nocardia sp. CC227C]